MKNSNLKTIFVNVIPKIKVQAKRKIKTLQIFILYARC